MENEYKVGDKVKCVSDTARLVKPGTILTISKTTPSTKPDHNYYYKFVEKGSVLWDEEITPIKIEQEVKQMRETICKAKVDTSNFKKENLKEAKKKFDEEKKNNEIEIATIELRDATDKIDRLDREIKELEEKKKEQQKIIDNIK